MITNEWITLFILGKRPQHSSFGWELIDCKAKFALACLPGWCVTCRELKSIAFTDEKGSLSISLTLKITVNIEVSTREVSLTTLWHDNRESVWDRELFLLLPWRRVRELWLWLAENEWYSRLWQHWNKKCYFFFCHSTFKSVIQENCFLPPPPPHHIF